MHLLKVVFNLFALSFLTAFGSNLNSTYKSNSTFCKISSNGTSTLLKSSVSANIVACTDSRFGDLRLNPSNNQLNSDASYIVYPKSKEEIVKILKQAVDNGLRPTVRSGGHCFEDFWSNNTGGVLIDLSLMNRIYASKNNDSNLIWVEPGAKLGDFYSEMYKRHGTTAPGGSCLDLGVGGHVLGAGYGFLSRKYGLISDYAHAMEIVYVKRDKTVHVTTVGMNSSSQLDKDLFWALRGGGSQNFGIITQIAFTDLPPSVPSVIWIEKEWKLSDLGKSRFNETMTKYVNFFVQNSQVGNRYCDLFSILSVSLGVNGSTMKLQLLVTADNQKLARDFFNEFGFKNETIDGTKMSLYRHQMLIGGPDKAIISLDEYHWSFHSALMVGKLPQRQVDVMWDYFTNSTLINNVSDGTFGLRSYGCAVSKLSNTDTAYAHRKAVIKLQFATWYNNSDAGIRCQKWSNSFYDALYGPKGPMADDVMDGCYYNYPDRYLKNWQHLYFKDNYEKLTNIKSQWDPLNIFRHRQSVELP